MRIKIALVENKHVDEAQELSVELQEAMEAGEMRVVDKTTERLLSFADEMYAADLSEESWRIFLEKIRMSDEYFQAEYILKATQIEQVLTCNLIEIFPQIIAIAEYALKTGGVVLQLPYEDEVEKDV
jgi:hypothetical protein